MNSSAATDEPQVIHADRLWRDRGWTARVVKNEEDDGWAVEMTRDGEADPALVGPWTMGRDKKNPKPLDAAAFGTLVKTAHEVVRRREQQLQAPLQRRVEVWVEGCAYTVRLAIVPDEDDPHGVLSAHDAAGAELASVVVAPTWRLTTASATAWIEGGFGAPR